MPAALDVDWAAVKLLVIRHGVREAARMTGIAPGTLMARSSREGWIADLPRSQALPQSMQPKAVYAISACDAEIAAIRARKVRTRCDHSEVAAIAAADLLEKARENPASILEDGGQKLLNAAKHASITDGWQEMTTNKLIVCIQAGAGAAELPLPDAAQDIELSDGDAEVTACDPMDDPMFN